MNLDNCFAHTYDNFLEWEKSIGIRSLVDTIVDYFYKKGFDKVAYSIEQNEINENWYSFLSIKNKKLYDLYNIPPVKIILSKSLLGHLSVYNLNLNRDFISYMEQNPIITTNINAELSTDNIVNSSLVINNINNIRSMTILNLFLISKKYLYCFSNYSNVFNHYNNNLK